MVVITDKNRTAELFLHDYFDSQRLPGSEYFNLEASQLKEAITIALQYGSPLNNWRKQASASLFPERKSLQNKYIEITRCFHRHIERDIRLSYKERMCCILDRLDVFIGEEKARYFTVFLDIQLQRKKLNWKKGYVAPKDWYLRLQCLEDYADRFFKLFRVYTLQTDDTYESFNLKTLLFTTVNSNKIIPFSKLPLAAQILFMSTWRRQDVYQDIYKLRRSLNRDWNSTDDFALKAYLESWGPYYYSKNSALPMPNFSGKVKSGKE